MSENNQNNQSNQDNKKPRKQGFVIPTDNEAVRERKKRQEKKLQEEIEKQQDKFEDGQILSFVRVRFPGHAHSFPFLTGNRTFMYGQKVVAMSDRGVAVGYINSFPYEVEFDPSMLPIKSINKIATEEDIQKDLELYRKQKETETVCLRLIEKHNLDMNLTHVEFTQFGKKVVFYFTAPARVDFRNLVKDLVGDLKLRIELRQISVRDRSAAIGGIGPCGRLLCCSSFLDKYGAVNIKMAKNQNLTLTFSKLNGVCGQLKCCLQYENDVYYQRRKSLPEEQAMIETYTGDKGKVIRLHLLNEQFDLLTDRGKIKRFTRDQVKQSLGANYKFPHRFDHISDETSNIIGLAEFEANAARKFEKDIERLKKKDSQFVNNVFKSLFGEEYESQVEEKEEAISKEAKTENKGPEAKENIKEVKEENQPPQESQHKQEAQASESKDNTQLATSDNNESQIKKNYPNKNKGKNKSGGNFNKKRFNKNKKRKKN